MNTATEEVYQLRFQKKYFGLFNDAWKIDMFNPEYGTFWLKTIKNQNRMAKRRERFRKEGMAVPPIMIFSITNRCNLKCKGCYAHAQKRTITNEISSQRVEKLIDEASDLGIGVMLVAGGEPLMREDVLEMAAAHKEMIFPIFTNGLLLTGKKLDYFKKHKNLIPVLSLEGNREQTDQRRGQGLHAIIENRAREMKDQNQFFGLSITLTKENFDEVMHPVLMRYYYNQGCRLFFLVEYVPNSMNEMDRCLTEEQKEKLISRLYKLRKEIPSLFISLPGEEEQYGGCLAAGRGFVHVSSDGQLEPCPFAPYSDSNLNHMSLKDALNSRFLENIRSAHHLLTESKGGCTLWENKEWVENQLNEANVILA